MHTATLDSPKALLIGQDAATESLAHLLAGMNWQVARCDRTHLALRLLRQSPDLDVVLAVPDGRLGEHLDFCRSIKHDPRTSFVSVMMLLDPEDHGRAADVLAAGVDDCIRLPAGEREILLRFEHLLKVKRAADSLEDAGAMIEALANAVEGKDQYTCGHIERVSSYAMEIGRRLSLGPRDMEALRIGGVVHDIGKIGVPDHILNKPGKLTDDEWAVIKRHPVIGYTILEPLRTFRDVLPIVRWHHEKPNGKGYPDGLTDAQLPLLPRIAAVADVFDALVTDRPYRPAFSLEECERLMREDAEKGNLDAALVGLFIQSLHENPLAWVPQKAA